MSVAGAERKSTPFGWRGACIVGVPRSGTTLLRALLDGHPDLLVLPWESHAVNWAAAGDPAGACLATTRYGRDLEPPELAVLERVLREHLEGPTTPGRALEALATAWAAVVDAAPEVAEPVVSRPRCWVDKTPKHLAIAESLAAELTPAPPFVCLLRDPRSVLASRITRWQKGSEREVRRFVRHWAVSDARCQQLAARHPGFLNLRYEDLVTDPRTSMELVTRHFELTWNDALLQPSSRGRPWVGRSGYQGVSTDSLERWRDVLTPEQIAWVERPLGTRMQSWGYALSTEDSPRRRLWFEMRVQIDLLRKGRANR